MLISIYKAFIWYSYPIFSWSIYTKKVIFFNCTISWDCWISTKKIIISYEPIWSIGTGKIPTTNELKKTTIHIKKVLKNIFKKKSPPVLYGGSVDGSNVEFFKEIKEIDGFLIGGASKSAKKFIDIIKNYYR